MYGDTDVIRGLARTMRDQGDAVRAEADALLARAETTPWSGLAADAMRSVVRAQVHQLRESADLADQAAVALDDHAAEVDERKALIAAVEQKVADLVAAARDRLSSLVAAVLPDPVDELLDRFVPPPSGHRDWLTLDLPGLS